VFCFSVLYCCGVVTTQQAYQLVRQELAGSDVPLVFIQRAFFDKRTRVDTVVLNKLQSKRSDWLHQIPKEFYKKRIVRGIAFYKEHARLLQSVAQRFNVDPTILLSIIGVETNYGTFLGMHDVFNAWFTQVVAIPERSAWAVKELAEWLRYCYARTIDPHAIKGSHAGAFGYTQFIPSSFNRYGIAFDSGKLARHDSLADSLASTAHYLEVHGYGNIDKSVRASLYAYNHSEAYVDVVIQLSRLLKKELAL
jgi:membrane-bound lytic murein transglycosylase B